MQHAIDRHSRTLVVNNIEMFLNYCVRFYDRQFITRSDVAGKDILARFERTLDDYFLSDKPQTEGLPTVQYCAQELHLSANYFGDLVKRLTGKTAQEHIRLRLIWDSNTPRTLPDSSRTWSVALPTGTETSTDALRNRLSGRLFRAVKMVRISVIRLSSGMIRRPIFADETLVGRHRPADKRQEP